MQSLSLQQHRQLAGRRSMVQRMTRTRGFPSFPNMSSMASVTEDGPELTKTPWFKKPCPGFIDVASIEELNHLIKNSGGKMTVLDCYAGWCSCCKGAYPTLCKIPSLGDYAQNYQFVKLNIEMDEAKLFIREYEVRGIPHAMVFDASGQHVIGMGASFKKLDALKANLHKIAETRAAGQPLEFRLDPNGYAQPR